MTTRKKKKKSAGDEGGCDMTRQQDSKNSTLRRIALLFRLSFSKTFESAPWILRPVEVFF